MSEDQVTSDAASDVVEQVRRAVEEARVGLARVSRPAALPPPVHRPATLPPPVAAAAPTRRPDGRWQPPPRLRPAEVPAAPALLPATTAHRRHLDWRWALAGVVAAAAIGVGARSPCPATTLPHRAPTSRPPPPRRTRPHHDEPPVRRRHAAARGRRAFGEIAPRCRLLYAVAAGAASAQGATRTANEDAWGHRHGRAFVVADGMGGRPGGAGAAAITVDGLLDELAARRAASNGAMRMHAGRRRGHRARQASRASPSRCHSGSRPVRRRPAHGGAPRRRARLSHARRSGRAADHRSHPRRGARAAGFRRWSRCPTPLVRSAHAISPA